MARHQARLDRQDVKSSPPSTESTCEKYACEKYEMSDNGRGETFGRFEKGAAQATLQVGAAGRPKRRGTSKPLAQRWSDVPTYRAKLLTDPRKRRGTSRFETMLSDYE